MKSPAEMQDDREVIRLAVISAISLELEKHAAFDTVAALVWATRIFDNVVGSAIDQAIADTLPEIGRGR